MAVCKARLEQEVMQTETIKKNDLRRMGRRVL